MTDRPALMYLGDALRWFRHRHHLTQAETGVRMGFNPNSAQRLVSMRELPEAAPDHIVPTVAELVNLEDATDVPRGTILRHAGYVASMGTELPADLLPGTIAAIEALVKADRETQAMNPTPPRRQRRNGPVRPRDPDES